MEPTINKPISPYYYREYSDLKQLIESKILVLEDSASPASPSPYPVFSYKMQPSKQWKWGKAYPKRKSVTLFDVNEFNQLIQVKISIPQRSEDKEVCPQLETFEKYSKDALDMMYNDFLNVKMVKKDFDTKYALKNKSSNEVLSYMEPYFQRSFMHPGYPIRHIWLVENEYRQHRVLFVLGYWEKAWRLIDIVTDADYDSISEQLYQFLNSHPDYTLDQMEGQVFICINFAEGLEEALYRKFSPQRKKIMLIRDSMQMFIMLENLQRSSQSYFLTGKIHEFAAKLKDDYTGTYQPCDKTIPHRHPANHKEDLIDQYYAFTHFLNGMIEQYPEEHVFQKKAWQYLRVFSHISEQELTMQLYFKQYAKPIPFYLYEVSSKLVAKYGFGVNRMAMLFKKHSVLDDKKIRQHSSMLSSSSSIIGQFNLTLPVTSSMEYSTTYYEEVMDVIAQINQKIVSAYRQI